MQNNHAAIQNNYKETQTTQGCKMTTRREETTTKTHKQLRWKTTIHTQHTTNRCKMTKSHTKHKHKTFRGVKKQCVIFLLFVVDLSLYNSFRCLSHCVLLWLFCLSVSKIQNNRKERQNVRHAKQLCRA